MSHCVVLAVVPGGLTPEALQALLNERMDPYSENLKVPEYDKPCWCIGSEAREDAQAATNAKFGPLDAVRDEFWQRHPQGGDDIWQELNKKRFEFEKNFLAEHPKKNAADPECSECHGTGTYRTTYNPSSKWDWWRIGGRWDGWITGTEQSSENGFNFSYRHEPLAGNIRTIDSLPSPIPDDLIPYAILSDDGRWNEKGHLGWFGRTQDEKADWPDQARALLESYRGKPEAYMVVTLDIHI
jgi:hypothetical protein